MPGKWVSPYRLLWGAAYSIGIAEQSLAGRAAELVHIPLDLSSSLDSAVHRHADLPWFYVWHASYMLTSAIFRVAAAAENICYLAIPDLDEDRPKLWSSAANADSPLSRKVPKAYELLGKQMRMPKREDRPGYLQAQREAFASSQQVTAPLMCAFMQTDRDKHVAYSPLKELGFEHALAISAILPQNARSRRVAERSGARAAGQMEVVDLTWDRYVWPLATGGAARLQPASTT